LYLVEGCCSWGERARSGRDRIEEGLPLPTEQSLNRKESLGEEGEEREEREGSNPDS
jgi:hypothetical protein